MTSFCATSLDYPDVNVIEVIGHTDEQPLVQRSSNLDELLMPVLQGKSSVIRLTPADNAGLGLARAVSVTQVLLKDERLSRLAILPYSGAQLVNVNDSLVLAGSGGDVKERRRIEIRLRKSDKTMIPPTGDTTTTISKNKPLAQAVPDSVPPSAAVPHDVSDPSPANALPLQAETTPRLPEQGALIAQPAQPAPQPKKFRPLRWMFGN